ncbi:type II toxin-antitoxin system RelE/ParE family toxin [Shewanella sp. 1180_01]|uniref:type II toxin-antitoxin system RelE/ParE family toxin n=1 Tax=Shewanella sp. 1180_01 TaxID=2604451 RepID=UPI0040639D4B
MIFEIVWLEDSIDDRVRISTYMNDVAGIVVAQRVDEKIQSAASDLSVFPKMAKIWDEETQTRRKVITGYDYSIFYTVDEVNKKIEIYRVLHDSMKI